MSHRKMESAFGFELQRDVPIKELNSRALYYIHRKTGARLLSMVNDDENKVFGITFRTPTADSTGVAHIMEHSVLCGSRKYPVKEPFVELLKGSLKTFLNALTYPDKTSYPAASTNTRDFYNMVDVYLDAVLHPRLARETLLQEGWHYEIAGPGDPLIYKGVVFNEMKGAYSSPDRINWQLCKASLFPETIYANDSGGLPEKIPDLSYEQFMEFHRRYYHPSNSYIFFYGDDDPLQRLKILSEYLDPFSRQTVNSEISLQQRFSAPRQLRQRYYAGKSANGAPQGMTTVNWLISDTLEPLEQMKLSLLDHALMGTPASPLWKALIDSGLGEDLSAGGLSGGLRQIYFSTGLKGMHPEDSSKVETLIQETLRTLAQEGIDRQIVESSLNTIEFTLRENNTGSLPRGLSLMFAALSVWLYDGDPISALQFERTLKALKRELKSRPRLLEEMIEHYFLDNTHRTTVILEPDESLAEEEAQRERQRLATVQQCLGNQRLQELIDQTMELQRLQNTPDPPEALAKIPRLSLSDLDRKHQPIPLEIEEFGGSQILYHDLFTNGILYLDLGFDLHQVPQRLIPYLGLFGRVLLELGTEKEDFVSLTMRIGRETGGIDTSLHVSTARDGAHTVAHLLLSAKVLASRSRKLFPILRDLLSIPNLDNRERFRQIVLDTRSSEEAALSSQGHGLVRSRIGAAFNEAGWLEEQLGGVSFLFFLRELAQRVEGDWPGVLADLRQLHDCLTARRPALANVTVDDRNWLRIRPQLQELLNALPAEERLIQSWQSQLMGGFEALSIPAQVNFVGKGANLFEGGYRYHGSAQVVGRYLRTNYLWNAVRVRGGAYGAFADFNRHSGLFTFLSYRDPNLLETLERFDEAGKFLRENLPNEEELTRNIIGTISQLDTYRLPDARGRVSMIRYLSGNDDEDLQKLRDEVLSTSAEHFRRFADALDYLSENGIVVVAGGDETLRKVDQQRPDWLKICPVL